MPPSEVLNERPSAVVTVAERASEAWTPDRSVISGKGTRCHVWPLVERRTAPPAPTTQQTLGDGDEPAVSAPVTSLGADLHLGPHRVAIKAP